MQTGDRLTEETLDWRALYQTMTVQQRIVHRACRWGLIKQVQLRFDLFQTRRLSYLDELNLQARRVGCEGRRAWLSWGPTLQAMNRESMRDGKSIRNTFNYFLAKKIIEYGALNPNARYTQYMNYLRAWEEEYSAWKIPQVLQHAESQARARAIRDFYEHNRIEGQAIMLPLTAVCPVCQGWLDRIRQYGPVPLRVATANSPPYHPGCPHRWVTIPARLTPGECARLWMGGRGV